MSEDEAVRTLQRLHFLRGADEATLLELARDLRREEHRQGSLVTVQGQPCQDLVLVARGELSLTQGTAQGEQALGILEPGDTLGELEFASGGPWRVTAVASRPSVVYRWPRAALSTFLEGHPGARQAFRFTAQSRESAERLRFPWLAEGEVIYALARKHPVILAQSFVLPALLLLASAAFAWWGWGAFGGLGHWGALGLAAFAVLLGLWQWIDWGNDYYIVTNRRVVWLEKGVGLYDSRQEAPLHMVLSVSVSTDVLGRMLGFGDVIVRTYTGQIPFRHVGNPWAMAAMVEEHWHRARFRRGREDREGKIQAVQELLQREPEEDEPLPPPPPPPSPPPVDGRREAQIGLDHWTFQMRFEEQGVITYRKHWFVLLRRIGLPSLTVLTLVGLMGARLGGLIQAPALPTALLGLGALLVPAALWWLYEYADWANDIYQVTPKHIVDVHKKPLAREVRKVAPLENILGTEVDRKGILGLLLNYGNVITNVGTEQFIFEGVFDPAGVQQDIVRALDAHMERQRQAEARQRREEMVEWLSVYHRQMSSRRAAGETDEES